MNRNTLKINAFFAVGYLIFSLFTSIISSNERENEVALFNISLDVSIKSCPGEIAISAIGGSGSYTYSWETRASATAPWQPLLINGNPVTSRRISGAVPADYRVTVRDTSNPPLQNVGIYTLSPPITLAATTHFEGLICSAEPNSGLALIEFDNGFPDYVWELVQGSTTIQQGTTDDFTLAIQNLAVGTYTLNWRDDNDCTGTKTITIAGPPSPLAATFTSQNVTCPGGSNGSINVTSITGGWGPTYLIRILRNGVQVRPWGPAQTSYANLPAGVYTIEYSDKVNPANGLPFSDFTFSINQFTGCNKSATITITEPAPFNVPVTQSAAVCQGDTNGFLSLIPNGGSPPYQVTFYTGHFDNTNAPVFDPNDMTSIGQQTGVTSGQTVTKNGLAAGQYAIQLIDVNGCKYSGNFTLIENPKGQVNATADNAVCAGSPVSVAFATTNSGGTTTYSWTNTNAAIGLATSGTGNISFTSTNTTNAPIQGEVTVIPTYTANGVSCVGPSDTFIITVNPKPVIQNSNPTICSGDAFTVSPANGGATIVPANTTYTWTVSTNSNVTGQSSQSAAQTSISQTLTNTSNTVQTVTYTVTPTSGAAGNCVGGTFQVVVSVNPRPSVVNETIAVCSNAPISYTATHGGSNIVPANTQYTWIIKTDNNDITGKSAQATAQASFTQTLRNTTNTQKTIVYTLTPSSGTCVGTPFDLTVLVNPSPEIAAKTAAICSAETFTVSPTNTVVNGVGDIVPTGTTYTWTVAANNNVTGEIAETTPRNSISQQLINTSNTVQTVTYTVTPTSGATGNCVGQTFQVVVTVNPKPSISNETIPACSNAPITYTATNGGLNNNIVPANTQYTWIIKTDDVNITGQSAQPTAQASFTQTLRNTTNTQKTIVYTLTPISGTCPGTAFDLTVQVNPTPEIVSEAIAACSNAPITYTATHGGSNSVPANTTYTWTIKTDNANITGKSAQSTAQSSFTQTLKNTTNTPKDIVYTLTPKSGNCTGTPFDLTVTVNPTPEIQNSAQTICSGDAFTVAPANAGATIVPLNTTYTWTISTNNNVTGQSPQTTAQTSISQTLTNTTNTVQTVTYTVTPRSGADGNCVGATFQVVVTINPRPSVTNPGSKVVCSNSPLIYVPTNGLGNSIPAGTKYTWTIIADDPDITGQTSQSTPQFLLTQTLRNRTNVPKFILYELTPISGTCIGSPFNLSVTVNPTPEIASKTAAICSSETFTIAPTNTVVNGVGDIVPTGTTYSWTVADNPSVTGETDQPNFQANISQALTNTSNTVQTVTYTVTPRSGAAGNCFGQEFQVSVQVNPKPFIQAIPETVCSGSAFTISPANGNGNIVPANTTYSWTFVNNTNVTGEANGTAAANFTQTLTNTTTTPQQVVYTVTPTSGVTGNCIGNPFTVTVTVNPTIQISDEAPAPICSRSSFTVTPVDGINGNQVPAGMQYTWTVTPNANVEGESNQSTPQSSISQVLRNTTTSVQTVEYVVTPIVAGSCSGGTFRVTVTVNPTPEIENTTATICSGDAFSVTPADGNGNIVPTGTRYSWTVLDNPNVTGENIGTSQPSISQFLTNNTNTVQTVTYTVTPTSGAAGSCVGATFQIVVTVNPRPRIANETITACSNEPITYTATNGGTNNNIVPTNTQYTWTIKANNTSITGQSAQATAQASFTQILRNTTNTQKTITYELTPISGTCAGTPFDLVVQVNPTPEIAAKTAVICSTDTFIVSPANAGSGVLDIVPAGTTYTWTVAPNNNVTGESTVAIAQTSISQALTNTTNTVQTVVYTVTPKSGATGNCFGQTFQVSVQVNPKPVIQPIIETVCSASSFTITPSNGNGNIIPTGTTYTWTFADNPSVTGEATGTAQASFTQTLTNTTTTPQQVIYTVTPTSGDTGNCVGSPFTVTITVNPTPVIADITNTICSNTSFLVTPQDGSGNIVPAGTTYTWTVTPNANVEGESNQTTAQSNISQPLRNTTNTVQTVEYLVTPRLGTCPGTPFRVTITVNPTPEIENTTAIICSGDPFTISPTNTVVNGIGNIVPANTTYTWTVAANTNVTGQSNQTTGQTSISQTLTNTSNTVQTVTYTVTPRSGATGNCVGATFQVEVTVNPRPSIVNETIVACSNAPITYTATQGSNGNIVPSNTQYTWTIKTDNSDITGKSAQATAQASFTQTLRNTTNAQKTIVYTLTPISGTCAGTPFDLTIQVNPTPEIAAKTAVICSEATFFVTPANTVVNGIGDIVPAGTTYTWTVVPNNNVTGETTVATAQANISQALINTTNQVQTVVYNVTPRSGATGNCVGQTFQVSVQVNPKPVVVQSINETVCSANLFTITPINGNGNIVPTGTTYSWTFADNTNVTGEANGTAQANFTQTLTNTTTTPQVVTYTVTPTSGDAGNCVGNSFTINVTVNPTPVISAKQLLICSGDTFTFTLTDGANGDKIPTGTKYTWTVIPNPQITGAVNQSTPQNSILVTQALINTGTAVETITYQVTPSSATGCSGASFNLVITVKPPIVINGEPNDYNGFGISCFGANDGFINLNPSGGKLPTDPAGYTYSWTGPNGFSSTAQNINNLIAGTYTVTVGEGSGLCTQTKTFVVTEPQQVVITETITNYNGFEISCFGASDGRINLAVTGGTSAYTYLWTAANGGVIPTGMQTAANLTGVPAGSYTVKVLDLNGCEKIETYVLRQPAPVAISEVVANRRNILCYGEATGNITGLGSGGVKEYTYSVTGTDYTGTAVSLTSGPTNLNLFSFSTLKAGQYVLTLTDLNGCQKSVTDITLTQPLAPIQITNEVLSNYNGFNIACFGDTNGSITHQVIGGTPFSGTAPYRYAWTGPNGFSSTSLNLSNLAAGTYRLTITDAVNCTLVKTYEMRAPDPVDVDAVKQNVLCGGELTGNIFIRNVTGGTGTYEFLWLKDGVGEIKRSRTPEDLRGIGPGRYILLVTDQNFCEYIEVFDVTEPVALVTTLTKKENNLCFGDAKGSIQINVTGGTAPYRYAWTGPGGYTSTNKDLTGLLSGTYNVLVTDALLCTSSLSVTITQPTEILVTPALTMVSCPDGKDGAISMTVSGGIPPYVYAWVGPNGFRSSTKDLTALSAGRYDLVITDGIGCKITRTFEITDPEPIVLTPTISNFNGFEISCKNGSDGVIDLNITGGNGGYKIFWEGPKGFRSNLAKLVGLVAGTYEVTVIDSKNCISKATYTLDEPDELLITRDDVQITDVSCFDGKDGTLTVTIKKASVGPYRYELSGSSVTGFPVSESILSPNLSYQFTGLRAGSYTLRVSDANGCALSELSGLVVTQPSAGLSFTIQKTDVACYRANNGTIRVTPAGGTAPYTIRWNNLSTSFTLQNLSPGTYTATITDAKGCTVGVSSTVAEAPVYDLQEVVKNISCFGRKDGSIQLNIIGGKAPIKIQWAHGPQEPTLNNLEKGVYSVIITDAGGCKIERQFVINEPQALDLSSTVTDALDCDDPNTGSISVTPFGGTPPYTYTWSNGARSQNLTGIAPGSYSLELVDAMGCRILRQFTVIRPKALEVAVTRTTERICNPRGLKSNFKVAVTGGIAPYTVTWNRGTQTNGGLTMDTQELGVFIVTVTDARGCIQTKRMEVIETDPLIPEFDYTSASFDFSYENLVNFDVQFNNSSIGKYKEVSWDFGDGDTSLEWEPVHQYAKAGTYLVELKLRDLDGCVVSFTKEIRITDYYLEFPNVFTPNDDSVNDHFYPKYIYIKDIHVLIMNKWGELLFESKDLESKGWDGKYRGEKAPIGNYVCKVRYTTLDGRVIDRSSVFYLGR